MTINCKANSWKSWFRLLIFIIICGITIVLLRTNSCEHHLVTTTKSSPVVRQKYYPDCEPFNPQATPQHLFQAYFALLDDSSWLAKPASHSPSFQELHRLLFGSTAPNLYEIWPNHYKMEMDLSYPYTSVTESSLPIILKDLKIPITFVVEVGSFTGKSIVNIATSLLNRKSQSTLVLLCIDTWLGGFEHWTEDSQRQLMGMQYGRPMVYEQFIANIIANNLTNYVLPYSTTSILGARFLLEKKLFPQIIYLDRGFSERAPSVEGAHLQGETYVELELYWLLIQDGGMLIGDDWSWKSVRCDVIRFVEHVQVKFTVLGNVWFIQKKKSA